MKSINKKDPPGNVAYNSMSSFISLISVLFAVVFIAGCRQEPNPPPFGSYDLKLVAGDFVSPLGVVDAHDGTRRLFVIDQIGKIWIIRGDGTREPEPFIDVSSKMLSISPGYDERGLLGLAFHPGFRNNHKFYLFYTAPPRAGGPEPGFSWNNLTRISEFRVTGSDPDRADPNSEKVILEADHPQGNHNGGTIEFGHDGYLYIAIGDGGNRADVGPGHVEDWYEANEGGNAQEKMQNLMGKILRIDVDSKYGKDNYGIPHDNPFVGKPGRDEIYAYGFRNPYRFSFDQGGANWLFTGDAGQSLYEEIDIVKKGGNYGWNVKEGTHCYNTADDFTPRDNCPTEDPDGNLLIDPIIEVGNLDNPAGGLTNAIVGGNVYRGKSIPFLYGKYIFGFLTTDQAVPAGKILVANPKAAGLWSYSEIKLSSFPGNIGQYVKGFGQSVDGEVYVTTSGELGPQGNAGKVYKLVFVK